MQAALQQTVELSPSGLEKFSLSYVKNDAKDIPSDFKSFEKLLEEARPEKSKIQAESTFKDEVKNASQTASGENERVQEPSDSEKVASKSKDVKEVSEKTEVSESSFDSSEENEGVEKTLASASRDVAGAPERHLDGKTSQKGSSAVSKNEKSVKNQKENLKNSQNIASKNGENSEKIENELSSWSSLVSRLSQEEESPSETKLVKGSKDSGTKNALLSEETATDETDVENIASLLAGKSVSGVEGTKNTKGSSEEDALEIKGVKGKKIFLDKEEKISVTDLRTEQQGEDSENSLKFSKARFDGKNSAEITVDIREDVVNTNVLSSNTQTAAADGSNFQAMLSNQLQQNAHEIVKTGNIILRDNDVGEIKLILNPEELGNVKINLHVSDKSISGKIIVQSEAAFNAMKESIQSLKEAFASSGYETSSFDLTFAGQDSSGFASQQDSSSDSRNQFEVARAYDGIFEDADDDYEFFEESSNSLLNSVNIVA